MIAVVGKAVAIPGAGPAAAVAVVLEAAVVLLLAVELGAAARSFPQAAISAAAPAAVTPNRPSRRMASRRDNRPST